MSATPNTSATTVAPLVAVETDIALPSPFIVPPRVRDASGASVAARRRRAESDRCTSLRPAPDTMTWFTACLPVKDGVAVHAALLRDKHVYCEQPLTHTIHEARALTRTAAERRLATQMGYGGH